MSRFHVVLLNLFFIVKLSLVWRGRASVRAHTHLNGHQFCLSIMTKGCPEQKGSDKAL